MHAWRSLPRDGQDRDVVVLAKDTPKCQVLLASAAKIICEPCIEPASGGKAGNA